MRQSWCLTARRETTPWLINPTLVVLMRRLELFSNGLRHDPSSKVQYCWVWKRWDTSLLLTSWKRALENVERSTSEPQPAAINDQGARKEWGPAGGVANCWPSNLCIWVLCMESCDKTELALYSIFWDLYHAQSRPGKARNFAQCICHKIDDNILGCANNLMSMKGDMTVSWSLAHPSIPEDKLLEFLTRLGSSSCRSGSIWSIELISNTPEYVLQEVAEIVVILSLR